MSRTSDHAATAALSAVEKGNTRGMVATDPAVHAAAPGASDEYRQRTRGKFQGTLSTFSTVPASATTGSHQVYGTGQTSGALASMAFTVQ
jgi:hypothetical protein